MEEDVVVVQDVVIKAEEEAMEEVVEASEEVDVVVPVGKEEVITTHIIQIPLVNMISTRITLMMNGKIFHFLSGVPLFEREGRGQGIFDM